MNGLSGRTKHQIALLAGDDLEEEEEVAEIRRLIADCPHCRQYWARVRGSLDILDRGGSSDEAVEAGLWPAVNSRLRSSGRASRQRKFNGWIPALSMAAACIAMLVAGQLDANWQHEGSWPTSPEQMAGGIHQSPWMPISQEMRIPRQAVPFPNRPQRNQFFSEIEWGTVLVESERIQLLVPDIRRDSFVGWVEPITR